MEDLRQLELECLRIPDGIARVSELGGLVIKYLERGDFSATDRIAGIVPGNAFNLWMAHLSYAIGAGMPDEEAAAISNMQNLGSSAAHYYIGRVYHENGRNEEALRFFEAGVAQPEAFYQMEMQKHILSLRRQFF